MAGKKKGVFTMSGKWAKHLRPEGRRAFWSGEREAAKNHIASEVNAELPSRSKNKVRKKSKPGTARGGSPKGG